MSVATNALIAQLSADAATLPSEIDRLDAAVWLEEYAVALPAAMGSTGSNIQSYTIAGRTVQYRTLSELNRRVAELRALIDGVLYGRGGYVDNREHAGAVS
jgi:hypothetical protein